MSESASRKPERQEDEEAGLRQPANDVLTGDDPGLEDVVTQTRLVEAALFAASAPVSRASLEKLLPEDADLGAILEDLREHYRGRGVELRHIGDAWAFRTAGDLAGHMKITETNERKLSRAAVETLAIIAFHQPVTRAEIENIRGVAISKGTIDMLMEAGWVRPGRRRESPGRPLTWVTTPGFLDHFGLENLQDLPGLEDMKAAGLMDARPAISTIPQTGELPFDQAGGTGADHDDDEDDDDDDEGPSLGC